MRLKQELETRLGAHVTLRMGMPGVLDVVVDGKRIFSKREQGRFPTVDELCQQIEGAPR